MVKEAEVQHLLKANPVIRETIQEYLSNQIETLLKTLETETEMDLGYLRYLQGRIRGYREMHNLVSRPTQ